MEFTHRKKDNTQPEKKTVKGRENINNDTILHTTPLIQ